MKQRIMNGLIIEWMKMVIGIRMRQRKKERMRKEEREMEGVKEDMREMTGGEQMERERRKAWENKKVKDEEDIRKWEKEE